MSSFGGDPIVRVVGFQGAGTSICQGIEINNSTTQSARYVNATDVSKRIPLRFHEEKTGACGDTRRSPLAGLASNVAQYLTDLTALIVSGGKSLQYADNC